MLAYVIGLSAHRLAVILSGALARIWRDGRSDLFTGIVSGFRKKGVASRGRLAVCEIGVFSHMSCEFELFMTTVVKSLRVEFHSSIEYLEKGVWCGRLLTVRDCGQVEYSRSVLYFLIYSSVILS